MQKMGNHMRAQVRWYFAAFFKIYIYIFLPLQVKYLVCFKALQPASIKNKTEAQSQIGVA